MASLYLGESVLCLARFFACICVRGADRMSLYISPPPIISDAGGTIFILANGRANPGARPSQHRPMQNFNLLIAISAQLLAVPFVWT